MEKAGVSSLSVRKSSYTLASDIKMSTGVSVHPSTVRRQSKTMSLKGCEAVKKLLLRKLHKRTFNSNKEAAGVLRTMNWQPQSSDLNNSECVCAYWITRTKNATNFWTFLRLTNIPADFFEKLKTPQRNRSCDKDKAWSN